jgi:PAS domain S-box-containing protein
MKKRIMRSGALLIFVFACPSVFAQLLQIRTYGTSDGLPQSEVVSIYQDRIGYMWFGTYEYGLARYDGRAFRRLALPEGLLTGAVHEIFQDRQGAMWFGTEEGLICVRPNPESGDTTISVFTENRGLPDNFIAGILEDAQGVLWAGTRNGAVCLIDTVIAVKRTQRSQENNAVLSMALAPDGSVWMGTQDGVNIWRGDSVRTLTADHGLADNWVRAVFCDRDGVMWLGTREGLTRVDNERLQTFNQKHGLDDTNIYALAQDHEGYLWIGARSGLSRVDPAALSRPDQEISPERPVFRHFDRRHGLSNDRLAALVVDYENNLWMGTWGGGVCKLKLSGTYIENYTPRNGLPAAPVYSFLEDSQGRVWIGTNGGGLAIVGRDSLIIQDTRNGLPNNVVHALAREPSGAIWIGTHGGAVRIPSERLIHDAKKWQIFTTQSGLPADIIRNIFCAPGGEVWLATSGAGAVCYAKGKFTPLTVQDGLPSNIVQDIHQDRQGRLWIATNEGLVLRRGQQQEVFRRSEGLPVDFVVCIFEDHAGDLWFGTRRGGAARYADGKFHLLSTADGLSDNVVYFIAEDRQQRLWFGTNAGIDCFAAGAGEFKDKSGGPDAAAERKPGAVRNSTAQWSPFFHLAATHGLADNECNTRATLHDRNGNLWFGTAGGATKLYPERLPPVAPAPRIHIESIEIGDRLYTPMTIDHPNELHLKAKAKTAFTFHFSILSFIDEQHFSSRGYLEGFDNGWMDLGNANQVRYTNLPPGQYTFHLRGANAYGIFSEKEAQVRLEILPPFYRRTWFIIGSIFLIAGLVYSGHLLRMRHVHKRNEELEKAVEEKTHSLQEAHAFLSSIKDFLPVGLLVIDPQRFVVEANSACTELFGYTQENLRRQELHNLLASEKHTRDKLWAILRESLSPHDLPPEARTEAGAGQSGIELLGLRRDGEKFPCHVHACSVRNESGELQYVILTCEDVAEWRQLEQQVIENEKQLALVDLLAGMGDVLNNKLVGIQGYLDLLKNSLTVGISHRQGFEPRSPRNPVEVVSWAQSSAGEMSTVLRQLLEFGAYLAKIPVLPVDLRVILRTLQRQWRKVLTVQIPEMPAPIPVKVIPKLKSGLDEAIRNSHEADATEVTIHVETLSNLSRVRLTLADNGRGISPENVSKVFLPFFKTKATPHPGLGLWKLRQLVKQSGGTVEIVFVPKGGTQLVITLPMATLNQLSDDAASQEAAIAEYAI